MEIQAIVVSVICVALLGIVIFQYCVIRRKQDLAIRAIEDDIWATRRLNDWIIANPCTPIGSTECSQRLVRQCMKTWKRVLETHPRMSKDDCHIRQLQALLEIQDHA